MSSPRLTLVILPIALALSLLTGGCGAPAGLMAAKYGADGVSLAGSGKTTGDHFLSLVTKKDCSTWRIVRGQNICREREGNLDPYRVNYDEPFRDQSEGAGISYGAPLRAASDAPVMSWDAAAYKPEPTPAPAPPAPVTAVAEAAPAPQPAVEAAPAAAKVKKPKVAKSKTKAKAKIKKPSPDQAAAVP